MEKQITLLKELENAYQISVDWYLNEKLSEEEYKLNIGKYIDLSPRELSDKIFEHIREMQIPNDCKFSLDDFVIFQTTPMGTQFNKYEYEDLASYMVNKHIESNTEFNIPLGLSYKHDKMVELGYLKHHNDKFYTLTNLSLSILHDYQQNNE